MTANAKTMLTSNFVAQLGELFGLKLKQLVTSDAVKVIVRWVTVVVFIHTATIEFKASQQTGINELFECSIDSWSANVVRLAFARELVDQLVGIEMLVAAEDLLNEESSLVGFS